MFPCETIFIVRTPGPSTEVILIPVSQPLNDSIILERKNLYADKPARVFASCIGVIPISNITGSVEAPMHSYFSYTTLNHIYIIINSLSRLLIQTEVSARDLKTKSPKSHQTAFLKTQTQYYSFLFFNASGFIGLRGLSPSKNSLISKAASLCSR